MTRHRSSAPSPKHRQQGLSLIEVLIAALILAIGLLGIAAMQAVTLKNSQSAFDRTQAVVLSYSMFDAMRANATSARANGYTLARTCTVPSAGSSLASRDQARWIQSLKDAMGPSACGTISACVSNVCSITVEWNDSRATDGDPNETLTTTSRI
ncbi:type IV pilus modification protein PilV [Arenimonas sp.]|uniref:type IV pilus modification protein PilV n=1 Tax=Arenimonas sp. TaxID=1872635 RepID=UPI002E37152C|nr:type IV pilus modification protein PilV [Arenimonas sp.]HEX4853018.1 type IV pilus modification protein PilV [Arenimonas sp.]